MASKREAPPRRPPRAERRLNRSGPLTHAYAGAVVDTALGGLRPRP